MAFFQRNFSPSQSNSSAEILTKHLSADPLIIFDIGARGGINARWRRFFHLINYVGFEPEKSECSRLNSKTYGYNATFWPYALGGKEENRPFYVCKSPGSSSLLKPNVDFIDAFPYSTHMQVTDELTIDTTTLDKVCNQKSILPDYIKVDTQGSELEILEGGEKSLRKTLFIELEVEFNPQYKNQPLFPDIDLYLRDRGFQLLSIRRTFWRRKNQLPAAQSPYGGQIVHGDVLYYRESLVEDGAGWGLANILKFLLILSAYRQDDFIMALLSEPHYLIRELSLASRHMILGYLVPPNPMWIKIGRRILGRINNKRLRKAVDILRPEGCTDWHDPDFF